jgi:hypothetical protein
MRDRWIAIFRFVLCGLAMAGGYLLEKYDPTPPIDVIMD